MMDESSNSKQLSLTIALLAYELKLSYNEIILDSRLSSHVVNPRIGRHFFFKCVKAAGPQLTQLNPRIARHIFFNSVKTAGPQKAFIHLTQKYLKKKIPSRSEIASHTSHTKVFKKIT